MMGEGRHAGRRPLIAGNWKMYMQRSEMRVFFSDFLPRVTGFADRDVVVCPSFTSLQDALAITDGSPVRVGAQTMHFALEGAYTGEVSPGMLHELGVSYVILGHSERRQYFNENDADLPKKLRAALDFGLSPILCVGETLDEREAERTEARVTEQLVADLATVTEDELPGVAIAYEPIWAIGTGRTATPETAQETIAFIRGRLADRYATAAHVRILYGGSVRASSIDALMAQADIDGVLVGGASLQGEEFARIVGFQTA